MLVCVIRKSLVAKTKEEEVRQRLLLLLLEKGYPPSHIIVEASLNTLPQFKNKNLPDRRFDILIVNQTWDASPLLLIECKAVPLSHQVLKQVIGYNHFLKAPFVTIANQTEIQTGIWKKEEGWIFSNGLPHYNELVIKPSNL